MLRQTALPHGSSRSLLRTFRLQEKIPRPSSNLYCLSSSLSASSIQLPARYLKCNKITQPLAINPFLHITYLFTLTNICSHIILYLSKITGQSPLNTTRNIRINQPSSDAVRPYDLEFHLGTHVCTLTPSSIYVFQTVMFPCH